jgi:hypothetical protein
VLRYAYTLPKLAEAFRQDVMLQRKWRSVAAQAARETHMTAMLEKQARQGSRGPVNKV